jgi:hypothetical protein
MDLNPSFFLDFGGLFYYTTCKAFNISFPLNPTNSRNFPPFLWHLLIYSLAISRFPQCGYFFPDTPEQGNNFSRIVPGTHRRRKGTDKPPLPGGTVLCPGLISNAPLGGKLSLLMGFRFYRNGDCP